MVAGSSLYVMYDMYDMVQKKNIRIFQAVLLQYLSKEAAWGAIILSGNKARILCFLQIFMDTQNYNS